MFMALPEEKRRPPECATAFASRASPTSVSVFFKAAVEVRRGVSMGKRAAKVPGDRVSDRFDIRGETQLTLEDLLADHWRLSTP